MRMTGCLTKLRVLVRAAAEASPLGFLAHDGMDDVTLVELVDAAGARLGQLLLVNVMSLEEEDTTLGAALADALNDAVRRTSTEQAAKIRRSYCTKHSLPLRPRMKKRLLLMRAYQSTSSRSY